MVIRPSAINLSLIRLDATPAAAKNLLILIILLCRPMPPTGG